VESMTCRREGKWWKGADLSRELEHAEVDSGIQAAAAEASASVVRSMGRTQAKALFMGLGCAPGSPMYMRRPAGA